LLDSLLQEILLVIVVRFVRNCDTMSSNELEVLEHYNRKILKYGDNSEVLLKCLGKLEHVRINIELLQITGIGKTVSALKKKYGDSDIGTVARNLVTKWKAAVDEEDRVVERASAEEENAPENENEADYDNDSPAPEYNPTPIDQLENGRDDSEQEPENEEESSQEDDHHSRKSKKKKSHRERRSEERETSRSDKHHKHKKEKDKEREKEKERSHKHKHSDKDKNRESKSHSKSDRDHRKEHKTSKSSHRDKSRADDDSKTKEVIKKEKCDRDQGDSKFRNKNGDSSDRDNRKKHYELKHGSRDDDKHHKNKQRLSSIDMFSKPLDEDEGSGSRKRASQDSLDDDIPRYKQPKLLDQKYSVPPLPQSLSSSSSSLIPEISPVYKPLPRVNYNVVEKQKHDNNSDMDLSQLLSNKGKGRSTVYSGTKRNGFLGGVVPSLFDQCIQVLKENVEYIEEVGGLPYDILKPVLLMANAQILTRIEDCNPHLMMDTSELWEKFVRKEFYKEERQEMESWREMYERCIENRNRKLDKLKGKVKATYKREEDSHKKTKLAYVDVAPKAPRTIRNAQVKNGTALPNGTPLVAGGPRPRNQISDPTANASRAYVAPKKPKTAPLMAKTFKLMRGIKGGFRR